VSAERRIRQRLRRSVGRRLRHLLVLERSSGSTRTDLRLALGAESSNVPAPNPSTREEEEATRLIVAQAVSHRELPPQLDVLNFIEHGRRFPTRAIDQQPAVVEDLRETLERRQQQPIITLKPSEGAGASSTVVPSTGENCGRRCGPSSGSTGRARGQTVKEPSQGANCEPVGNKFISSSSFSFVRSHHRRPGIVRPPSPPPETETRVVRRRSRTPPTKRDSDRSDPRSSLKPRTNRDSERGYNSHSLKPRQDRDSDRGDLRSSLTPRTIRDSERGYNSHSLKPRQDRDSDRGDLRSSLAPKTNRDSERGNNSHSLTPRVHKDQGRSYQSSSKSKRKKGPKLTNAANNTRLWQSARDDEQEQQRDNRHREQEARIEKSSSQLRPHAAEKEPIEVEPQPGISPMLREKLKAAASTSSEAVAVPIEVDPVPVELPVPTVSTVGAAVADSEVDLDSVSDTLDLGVAEEEKILTGP